MNNLKKNPKGSNMYSNINPDADTTPLGSHNLIVNHFYKYSIPSGLII